MENALARYSDSLADLVETAAPALLCLNPGTRAQSGAYLWQNGVAIASEQMLPDAAEHEAILPDGRKAKAVVAGRDDGTNVAVLRVEAEAPPRPRPAEPPRAGQLALALGRGDRGATVRLGCIHRVGPAWHSLAGARIDADIQLDLMLQGRDEGGPVLAATGALLGMSTLGPRRRAIVIPTATIERVLPMLLEGGRVQQGWLGLGLQPVGIPSGLREAAGREAGLMVVSLAAGGPAEQAGVLPGDILLDVAGQAAPHPRAVARALSGDQVGKNVPLRLLRAGAPMDLDAKVALRPAA